MKLVALTGAGLLICSTAFAQTTNQSTACRDGLDALRLANVQLASSQLTTCLQLDLTGPVRAYILQSRARAYRALNNTAAAIEDQKASLTASQPYDVWPFIMLSAYYRDQKQYNDAIETLKQALKFDEDGPGTGPGMAVYYHTGLTLSAMGKYHEAIDAFNKGIPKEPNYGHAYFARAIAYELLANRSQAKQDLTKASELIPAAEYNRFIVAKFKEYGIPMKPAPN